MNGLSAVLKKVGVIQKRGMVQFRVSLHLTG